MSMAGSPTLSLSAVPGSFPFQTKYITLPLDVTVQFGAETDTGSTAQRRVASPTNGWFSPQKLSGDSSVLPLPLSSVHSEVWWDGINVYIRDLDTPFGTYLNGDKVTGARTIRSGDIIVRLHSIVPGLYGLSLPAPRVSALKLLATAIHQDTF
ncbi:hypothetical protein C0992_001132 [Termitomyces sp. T32_za158]|nr:hypothetical protein C0992_001132 [Termitomyces sp. T32_za158]